ncbi:MAG: hypothetical protein IAF94_15335 [Pirellulaceae bacterium]|nr:hypothetical protein [Pirellulaceae bacterium]
MTDERGVLRRIAWRELFPWLIIFRTFRLAISPTLLLVATLAVFLSAAGWRAGELVFLTPDQRSAADPGSLLYAKTPRAVAKYLPAEESALIDGYFRLSEPFYRVFRRDLTIRHVAYYTFASLWSLAIWALAGGIITRRAVVEFGSEETPGFMETVQFAARRYLWYLLAPLYPLSGVLLLSLPIAALGFIAWLHDFGFVLAGVLWIFVILAGVVAAWLLAGLLFGWPLMWGTISAEREGDAFEAFSRSFSYVFGKPLHYLFYAVVAALFGALCWAVAHYAAEIIIEFGWWAFSWGAGAEQAARIEGFASLSQIQFLRENDGNQLARFGGILMALSIGLVELFRTGFMFSFFWCVAAAIYLLMRQDVDDKELDDVYVPAEMPAPRGPVRAAATPTPERAPAPIPATDAPPPPDQRMVETVQVPPP